MENVSDIFIIGGGINGTAIAADAAGRGLSVTLCEKGDLACGTSSASSKLIHGGLRYLELYEFNLVRKALKEREILLRKAPNIISPLEFVLPHDQHLKPTWVIRLGLFLYDHLSKRQYLPSSKIINFKKDIRGNALKTQFKKGFSYYDCITDDARLVVLNALSAKEQGATILTRIEFLSAHFENHQWKILLKNNDNSISTYFSKVLINASGPWVEDIHEKITHQKINIVIKLVKGSHIIIPKLYEGDHAYILPNIDDRVVFTIPYHNNFTLIGTTDILHPGQPQQINITTEEITYLCNVINHFFKKNINQHDILFTYSGLRCLQDGDDDLNPSKISRDYRVLEATNHLPLVTIIGGKITTHRALAEDVVNRLKTYFPNLPPSWTSKQSLPGCNFGIKGFLDFKQHFLHSFPWLPKQLATHYATNYGTNAFSLLENAKNIADLGIDFGHGLYQIEVEFLIKNEWAQTSEDILWRRTKFGLLLSKKQKENLSDWIQALFEQKEKTEQKTS